MPGNFETQVLSKTKMSVKIAVIAWTSGLIIAMGVGVFINYQRPTGIQIRSPKGGETYKIGDVVPITFYVSGQTVRKYVQPGAPPNGGNFCYKVYNSVTNKSTQKCIRPTANQTVKENLPVDVYLISGSKWTRLNDARVIAAPFGLQTFHWTIPSNVKTASNYKIGIRSIDGRFSSVSPRTFRINNNCAYGYGYGYGCPVPTPTPTPTWSPSPSPTVSPEPTLCAQVITSAIDPNTNECRDFPTPCAVPSNWMRVNSCFVSTPTPTWSPSPSPTISIPPPPPSSTVSPTPASYRITVTVKGYGVVNSDPAGISCADGHTCSATYQAGVRVRLTGHYSTAVWSGNCMKGNNECVFSSLYSDQNVAANFLAVDSDNSPGYTSIGIINKINYPDLFTKGVGRGTYAGAAPGVNFIFGLGPNVTMPKPTIDNFSTVYDYCANPTQVNEAFVTGDGKLGIIGVTCPYGCNNGVCLEAPKPTLSVSLDNNTPASSIVKPGGGTHVFTKLKAVANVNNVVIGKGTFFVNLEDNTTPIPFRDISVVRLMAGKNLLDQCEIDQNTGTCTIAPNITIWDGVNQINSLDLTIDATIGFGAVNGHKVKISFSPTYVPLIYGSNEAVKIISDVNKNFGNYQVIENKISSGKILIDESIYSLNPSSIDLQMTDGQGNKSFSFDIAQEANSHPYGYSVYGYGAGDFPTYAILGGSSGGVSGGNKTISVYFNDSVLSSNGTSSRVYKGQLPISVFHGSASGGDQKLYLDINLTVLPAGSKL